MCHTWPEYTLLSFDLILDVNVQIKIIWAVKPFLIFSNVFESGNTVGASGDLGHLFT